MPTKPADLNTLINSIYESAGLLAGDAVPFALSLSLVQDAGEYAKVPAGSEVSRNVPIGGGAPFVLQSIRASSAGLFGLKVETTQAGNLALMRDFLESAALFDANTHEWKLPRPIYLNADSALVVRVRDLSGALNRIHLAFIGYQPVR